MAKTPTDIRSLARSHSPSAIRTLAGIAAKGENESARVSAAIAILDRGGGKPGQSLEITRKTIRDYTDAELLAIVAGSGEEDSAEAAGTEH
jgi:hypothetical protein